MAVESVGAMSVAGAGTGGSGWEGLQLRLWMACLRSARPGAARAAPWVCPRWSPFSSHRWSRVGRRVCRGRNPRPF